MIQLSGIVDLWDSSTYDSELTAFLGSVEDVIRSYHQEEARIATIVAGLERWEMPPRNIYARPRLKLREELEKLLCSRDVRAFHYSRLADDEVAQIHEHGLELSTPESLRRRLEARVRKRDLSQEEADVILSCSPLQTTAFGERSGRIWSVSGPLPLDDGGVAPLLEKWGGESTYWCLQDHPLILERLAGIGRPRVVELAISLAEANSGFAASAVTDGIFAAVASKLGFECRGQLNDLYVRKAIEPSRVLRIHTAGDGSFEALGR